jgi:hypothetical protein
MGKYVVAWIPMIPIAIANGALREKCYAWRVGELRAHQISTGILLVLFGVYICSIVSVWPPDSGAQAVRIGLTWLAFTIGFEFLFGRFVAGATWRSLFRDYNLRAGRLWAAIPVWVAVAPWVFHRLQS